MLHNYTTRGFAKILLIRHRKQGLTLRSINLLAKILQPGNRGKAKTLTLTLSDLSERYPVRCHSNMILSMWMCVE